MFRPSHRRANSLGPVSSCSREATRHRRLPAIALTFIGVWVTGCSRPVDPPTDPSVVPNRSRDVKSENAPTAADVVSESPDDEGSATPDDGGDGTPDDEGPATRDDEGDAATGGPRSLADGLSRSPTSADAEAERATEEILAPLDDSDKFRPDRRAAKAFGDPPNGVRLSRQSRLWVDRADRRVLTDGYVTLREGYLEMFACPTGTKEHESIVATLSKSREVHAALLAVGATPGHPVRYDPEFQPPSGQSIRIWILWRDEEGNFRSVDARNWVRHAKSKEPLSEDWVFGGSDFWTDPADGREYYQADGGDMICVSNFGTAMLDVPFQSSADADDLLFVPFTERIPEIGTPVRLMLTPIAGTDADQDVATADQPPGEHLLPAAEPDRTPGDVPGSTSGDTSGSTSDDTPGDTSGDTPSDTSDDTPSDTSDDTPGDTLEDPASGDAAIGDAASGDDDD